MTFEIAIVLFIVGTSLVLFITDWVRMDVVALMVLCALALTGLATPTEALSGFSNAAVITVWSMFILSEGLTRAGVANVIGRNLLRFAGQSEQQMILVIMVTAGLMSGVMNNIGVAALMLPVIVDVARRSGLPAPRLLMPLAYGSLLGGLTTLVGTPPNLLISGALNDAGFDAFELFDFTPLGLLILLFGSLFVAYVGRHLLPSKAPEKTDARRGRDLQAQYGLHERMFLLRVPAQSVVVGRTIDEVGLESSARLVLIALMRSGSTRSLPPREMRLAANDLLLVEGRADRFDAMGKWGDLTIEREAPLLKELMSGQIELRELQVAEGSPLVDEPLRHDEFRSRYAANVLALRRGQDVRRSQLAKTTVAVGDRLLVQCDPDKVSALEGSGDFATVAKLTSEELSDVYKLEDSAFILHVPRESEVAGLTLGATRLADAFDFRLLGLFRDGAMHVMPPAEEVIHGGDLLIVQGRTEDIDVLRGLQELDVEYDATPHLHLLDSDGLQLVEATLHPHSSLAGRRVDDVNFRNRVQIELVAIWRNGRPLRTELGRQKLQLGDALLLLGPRERLAHLSQDPDLIVLTPVAVTEVDTSKAPIASSLMLMVVGAVLLGFLPIAIAAVLGATLMVLTRCLTMEAAYRAIDWRAIFLIAGMLPLGIAMERSGAASYLAETVMHALGDRGPWIVIAGLYAVTAMATMIVPTAALVLIMAPVVLSASAELGILPYAPMMAIAMAASASFTSPISHPANVLVMGPGGYRFVDYLKLGVPLTIVVFLVVAVFLPFFWPLRIS